MKCIVCGRETGDLSECPRCGFEVLEVLGEMTPELEKVHESYADRYRALYLGDIRLGVTVYEWKLGGEDEQPEKTGESAAWFEPWKELPAGQISWIPETFRAAKTVDSVELTSHIKKTGKREALRPMRFSTAGRGEEWQLGVRKELNGDVTFALGTAGRYQKSETINLFDFLREAEAE